MGYKQDIFDTYKEGLYIRKNNITNLFRFKQFGKLNQSPYDVVRTATLKKGVVRINGAVYEAEGLPVVITKEEAMRLNEIWLQVLSEPIEESKQKENQHIRLDNGQVKESLNEVAARRVLYKFRVLYPDVNYEIYKCTECDGIHLGKVLEETSNG